MEESQRRNGVEADPLPDSQIPSRRQQSSERLSSVFINWIGYERDPSSPFARRGWLANCDIGLPM